MVNPGDQGILHSIGTDVEDEKPPIARKHTKLQSGGWGFAGEFRDDMKHGDDADAQSGGASGRVYQMAQYGRQLGTIG
jgi:hypothetical protein